jgi:hypothetical protein
VETAFTMACNTQLSASLLAMAGCGVAWADGSGSPTLANVLENSGITYSGYIDASYESLLSGNHFGQNAFEPTYRAFDVDSNSFALNQVALTLAKQPEVGFGGLVNLIGGRDADYLPGSYGNQFDVAQAFVQYASAGWTFMGGKFMNFASAETIAPTGNSNVSRSLLFTTEPLAHTGLRVTYAPSALITLMAGVENAWSNYNADYSAGTGKTAELGFRLTPGGLYSVAVQGSYGPVEINNEFANRILINGIATVHLTPTLSVGAGGDWGEQQNIYGVASGDGVQQTATYWGAAAYVNWAISDVWRVAARGEYVDDTLAYFYRLNTVNDTTADPANKLTEGTITVGFSPVKAFELRLEGRKDLSNHRAFVDGPGSDGGYVGNDSQASLELEALYKFGN